jgi:hypothetical protein
MERWPQTIWVGAGVLVVVAGQMIYEEPLLKEYINAMGRPTQGSDS